MPGMMDTVLNLGLNDNTIQGLIKKTNNPRFAYDCYRRFIQMYSDVVLGVDFDFFEELMHEYKEKKGVKTCRKKHHNEEAKDYIRIQDKGDGAYIFQKEKRHKIVGMP